MFWGTACCLFVTCWSFTGISNKLYGNSYIVGRLNTYVYLLGLPTIHSSTFLGTDSVCARSINIMKGVITQIKAFCADPSNSANIVPENPKKLFPGAACLPTYDVSGDIDIYFYFGKRC